jgi:hypothetical protein
MSPRVRTLVHGIESLTRFGVPDFKGKHTNHSTTSTNTRFQMPWDSKILFNYPPLGAFEIWPYKMGDL